MIRENRRPLLAFALVAMLCAATIVQGVRSDAFQGFVAAQVPQVVVAGARLVPLPEETTPPAPPAHSAAAARSHVSRESLPTVEDPSTSPVRRERARGRPPVHAPAPPQAHGRRPRTGPPPGHQAKAERNAGRKTERRDQRDARRTDRGWHHRGPAPRRGRAPKG